MTRSIALGIAAVLLSLAVDCMADGTAQRRLTPDEISKLEQGGAGPSSSGMAGIRTTILS